MFYLERREGGRREEGGGRRSLSRVRESDVFVVRQCRKQHRVTFFIDSLQLGETCFGPPCVHVLQTTALVLSFVAKLHKLRTRLGEPKVRANLSIVLRRMACVVPGRTIGWLWTQLSVRLHA